MFLGRLFGAPPITGVTPQMASLRVGFSAASAISAIDPALHQPLTIAQAATHVRATEIQDRFVAALTEGGKLDEATMLQAFAETHAPSLAHLGSGNRARFFAALGDLLEGAAVELRSPLDAGAAIMVSYAPAWMFEPGARRPKPRLDDVARRIDQLSALGAATLFRIVDPLMIISGDKKFPELVQLIDMIDALQNNRPSGGRDRVKSAGGKALKKWLDFIARRRKGQRPGPRAAVRDKLLQTGLERLASALPPLPLEGEERPKEMMLAARSEDHLLLAREMAYQELAEITRFNAQEHPSLEALIRIDNLRATSHHPAVKWAAEEAIRESHDRFAPKDRTEHARFLKIAAPLLPKEQQGPAYWRASSLAEEIDDRMTASAFALQAANAYMRNGENSTAITMMIRAYTLSGMYQKLIGLLLQGDSLVAHDHLRNAAVYGGIAEVFSRTDLPSRLTAEERKRGRLDSLKRRAASLTSAAEESDVPAAKLQLHFKAADAYLQALMTALELDDVEEAEKLRQARDGAAELYFQALQKEASEQRTENPIQKYLDAASIALVNSLTVPLYPIPEPIAFAALQEARKLVVAARNGSGSKPPEITN